MGEIYLYYDGEEFEKDVYRIYAIRNDKCGYPKFLIRADKAWYWRSAKHFIPTDEAGLFDVYNYVDKL
jgi:hypothetical protein